MFRDLAEEHGAIYYSLVPRRHGAGAQHPRDHAADAAATACTRTPQGVQAIVEAHRPGGARARRARRGPAVIRAFAAIALPEAVRFELMLVGHGLPVPRPVPPENLHLTLVFLGELPEPVLADIDLALRPRCGRPASSSALAGLGLFGGAKPRVVYRRRRREPGAAPPAGQGRDRGARRRARPSRRGASRRTSRWRGCPSAGVDRGAARAGGRGAARAGGAGVPRSRTSGSTARGSAAGGGGLRGAGALPARLIRPSGRRSSLVDVGAGDADVAEHAVVELREPHAGAVAGVELGEEGEQPARREARPGEADRAQGGGRTSVVSITDVWSSAALHHRCLMI